MKVPPEIDRLMWAVAESPTDSAVLEFGSRYPDHRAELMKRMNMVRELKHEVRPSDDAHRELPRFQPKPPAPPGMPNGWPVAVSLAALALGTLAYAGYAVSRAPKAVPPPAPPVVNLAPPVPPKIVYSTAPPSLSPENEQPAPPPTPVDTTAAYLKPRAKVSFKDVSLMDALTMLSAESGMKLIIGPGFQDEKISLDYADRSTLEILLDLAKQYAFTVSDEGSGNFLVLPVPDNGDKNFGTDLSNPRKAGP